MTEFIDCLTNCKTIKKENIFNFIKKISNECDLSIKNITFNNDGDYGAYTPDNDSININYDLILEDKRRKKKISIIDFNTEIILTVIHELTHAVQKKQLFDNETYKKFPSYYTLLVSNFLTINNDGKFYCKNHDDLIIEYNANIISFLTTIKLLKKCNLDYSFVQEDYENYLKDHTSFNLEKNLFLPDLLNKIFNSKDISNEIGFKFKIALLNYGKEKNLSNLEENIYGYKK